MRKHKLIDLILISIFLLSLAALSIYFNFNNFCEANLNIQGDIVRAVSLKYLQRELKQYEGRGKYSEELLKLGGIKEILGVLFDKENGDIVLIGHADPNLPHVYIEDFVVALRNAWMKYATLKGNTYYYSNPGCSIDPNPNVIKELHKIGQNLLSSSDLTKADASLKEWHNVCKKPQNVRIMGIPFDSQFARIMVKGDYDMKKIADGTDHLDIQGLKSLSDSTLEKIQDDIRNNKPISVSVSMNRFWFYPGKNHYIKDSGFLLIEKCPVILLTENEYSSNNVRDDPLARKFAADFTANYDQIAKKRLIYKELETLFRFVAIAKVLKDGNFINKNKTETILSYLLYDFPLPQTHVDKTLAGCSAIKEFEHREDYDTGYQILHLWLPSCGGVDIGINVKESVFQKPGDDSLLKIKEKILNRRRDDDLYWDVDLDDSVLFFEVKYDPQKIENILDGIDKKITSNTEIVFLNMDDFPNYNKCEDFEASLQFRQKLQGRDIKVKFFDGKRISVNEQEAFLNGRVLSVDLGEIKETVDKEYKCYANAGFNLLSKIKYINVEIFSKTSGIINKLFKNIKSQITDLRNMTPAKILNRSIKELSKEEYERLKIELKGIKIVIHIKEYVDDDKWAYSKNTQIKWKGPVLH